jgi:hypothetical protein
MNDLIRSEDANCDLSLDVTELGRMSEETKGTTSGPLIETSALPFRVF